MSPFIESQKWRYATKKFDASKKISTADLETIKEAIQLSASSYGLQPYKVLIISDLELRTKLQAAAFNQSQITDASQLIVFLNNTNVSDQDVDLYIENISKTREIPYQSIEGLGTYMKTQINNLTQEQKAIWTSKQTYLALGNLLNIAAELKIDATPMEGFDKDQFDEILNLKDSGYSTSVIATIGYRHEEDTAQHYKKVRKNTNELFVEL